MVLARNVLIIAALAAVVALVPGGDNAADAVLVSLSLAFATAIGFALHLLWRRSDLTLATLDEPRRVFLFGAIAAIVLMFAAADEMLDTGLGALAWIAVLIGSGAVIYSIWREAHTY